MPHGNNSVLGLCHRGLWGHRLLTRQQKPSGQVVCGDTDTSGDHPSLIAIHYPFRIIHYSLLPAVIIQVHRRRVCFFADRKVAFAVFIEADSLTLGFLTVG